MGANAVAATVRPFFAKDVVRNNFPDLSKIRRCPIGF
jgi:hypothetical protein